MIKPNLIASHDWHVQPICQRSLRVIRLSGTPWIEVRTLRPAVLELDAHRRFRPLSTQQATAFWREPFKVIKVPRLPVKERIPPEPRVDNTVRTAQKSKSGQQKLPEPLGLAGDHLPGHAMACSLRDSLQGFNGAETTHLVRPYEPASHFPQDSWAGPHGHREAPLLTYNLIRVAQAARRCKHFR